MYTSYRLQIVKILLCLSQLYYYYHFFSGTGKDRVLYIDKFVLYQLDFYQSPGLHFVFLVILLFLVLTVHVRYK